MFRKGSIGIVLIGFLAAGIGSAFAADIDNYTGPKKEIRLSVHVPSTHLIWQKMLLPWANIVEKESKGKLAIKPYLGGVLHGARDGFKAVRGDVTDLAMCYPAWSPAGFHLNHVFGLPFAFPNASVAALVAEELYPEYLKGEYEKKGIYLGFNSSMATYDLVSTKPVRKLEDLKGMKVRTVAGPQAEAAKRLGAVPVFMSINEVYTALQRGMIDGVLTPNFAGYAYRFFELAKYVTRLDYAITVSSWGHNIKTFDALPKELKTPWYNLLRKESQYWANAMDEANRLSKERNKKEGIEVITLSPEEFARWKAAVQPLWDQFVEENEAKGLPARKLVQELKDKSKKYSSWTQEQLMERVTNHPVQGIIDF